MHRATTARPRCRWSVPAAARAALRECQLVVTASLMARPNGPRRHRAD